MELSFPAQQRNTWVALNNVSRDVALKDAPSSIHVWMVIGCRHLFSIWQGRQAAAYSPSYNPDTGKAHWAADGSQPHWAICWFWGLQFLWEKWLQPLAAPWQITAVGYSHWTWLAGHLLHKAQGSLALHAVLVMPCFPSGSVPLSHWNFTPGFWTWLGELPAEPALLCYVL